MILNQKLVCPACGQEFKMAEAADLEQIRRIARLAAVFGVRGWAAVEGYLKCFQTAPNRPLKPDKMLLLLEDELVRYWREECVWFERRRYHIDHRVLLAAMHHIAMREKAGFTNHNYLKKVAIDFQKKADQQRAQEEAQHERELFERSQRDPDGPKRIGEIIDGIDKQG